MRGRRRIHPVRSSIKATRNTQKPPLGTAWNWGQHSKTGAAMVPMSDRSSAHPVFRPRRTASLTQTAALLTVGHEAASAGHRVGRLLLLLLGLRHRLLLRLALGHLLLLPARQLRQQLLGRTELGQDALRARAAASHSFGGSAIPSCIKGGIQVSRLASSVGSSFATLSLDMVPCAHVQPCDTDLVAVLRF